MTRHKNSFCLSSNPSHDHLTIIMVRTLFIHLYTYLSSTHTSSTLQLHIIYLYIQNCPYTCTYSCQFVYCYSLFVHFNSYFIICVFCFVTVILLHCSSFCHENKFLLCINIPGIKAHSDSEKSSLKIIAILVISQHFEGVVNPKMKGEKILNCIPRLVCFFIGTDFEKFSITSLAH